MHFLVPTLQRWNASVMLPHHTLRQSQENKIPKKDLTGFKNLSGLAENRVY